MGQPYETRLNSIRKTYDLNVVAQITDEEFHETFITTHETITDLLAEGYELEAKAHIKEQIKTIKPYDHCHLIQDTYHSILDSIAGQNVGQATRANAKDAKLAEQRKAREETKKSEAPATYQDRTRQF